MNFRLRFVRNNKGIEYFTKDTLITNKSILISAVHGLTNINSSRMKSVTSLSDSKEVS